MKRLILVTILVFLILLAPLWMWLAWWLSPFRPLNIYILDKASSTSDYSEHRALNWVLMHEKYSKSSEKFYSVNDDYFGFHPGTNGEFRIDGLDSLSDDRVDSLAERYDAAFYTDVYGVYRNEWYQHQNVSEFSPMIYGGLQKQDLSFLKSMKEQRKLIICEFNFLDSPTQAPVREEAEELFGIQWTGWTGRYFKTLDTLKDPELPRWAVTLYKAQNNNQWPFRSAGIVFVHESASIVILEHPFYLETEVPIVVTPKNYQDRFDLPKSVEYPYWFDIVLNTGENKVVSEFVIETNDLGDTVLAWNKIPKRWPAVLEHTGDYRFYYLGGDFSDAPIRNNLWRYKGISWFRKLLYDRSDVGNRERFFWEYYIPFVRSVFLEYSQLTRR
ncbi:MAG: hypothetical protein Q8P51_14120 [Ignavibacteria bacterium]|nr:hypothetical protein [Ignavibacteria bacterium]